MKNIKTVIFDCDETLWIHRKDEDKILTNSLKIPLTEEFTKQYFDMICHLGLYFKDKKATIKKLGKVIEIYMPILKKYNLSTEKFIKTWFAVETSFINEDSLKLLHYLKTKRYKIVILSDTFYEKQIKLLKNYGILPYIDEIYTCDNHYLKSNPKSISRVITSGHESEYVIVGDSLQYDIAFANNAGIRSIWYNAEFKKNKTQFKPTDEVSSLLEIRRIL